MKTFARNGKASNLVIYNGSIATLVNTAPEIIPNKNVSEPFEVAGKDTLRLTFKIIDKENHSFTYEISKDHSSILSRRKRKPQLLYGQKRCLKVKTHSSSLQKTN